LAVLTLIVNPPASLITPVPSWITISGSAPLISVQSQTGYQYQLQRSSTLGSSAAWANIGSAQAGTGYVLSLTDPAGILAGSEFYRVLISQ
jgi:hypothetical protein